MQTLKFILILLVSFKSLAQMSAPPERLWITDSEFENKINEKHAFGDDDNKPVLIEFWADFNKDNCFPDWDKIENAIYYRVDIAKAPLAKKKYRIRMAPTLIIFKNGSKEIVFKAGLDLVLPTDLNEVQEAINEINTASKF